MLDLTDRQILREFLERHGLWAKKALGQHFLCSKPVVEAILAELEGIQSVLEIGPGPGVLTSAMSKRVSKVSAIELDPRMAAALSESAPEVQVLLADVLKVDLSGGLRQLPEPRAVVSNMPYNITGPLLTQIAAARQEFGRAVLMMQREVGHRIMAQPGNSERGSLSVFLQTQFEIRRVCNVPAGSFMPPPKVDSVVLRFDPKETGLSFEEEGRFFKLVRACFRQPRKTLLNNLSALIEKDQASACLERAGLQANIRPHALTEDQWRVLWQTVETNRQ